VVTNDDDDYWISGVLGQRWSWAIRIGIDLVSMSWLLRYLSYPDTVI